MGGAGRKGEVREMRNGDRTGKAAVTPGIRLFLVLSSEFTQARYRMIRWIAILVLAFGRDPVSADDRLIPFDDFYISVDTNWRAAKGGEGEALQLNVQLSRHGKGTTGEAEVEISCSAFSSEARQFSAMDLETFLEACVAAKKGEYFRKEILSPTLFGTTMTRFRTDPVGNKHVVRVLRGKVEVYFTTEEGDNTREAVALAEAGRLWYQLLLRAKGKLPPQMTPEAHPPMGEGLTLMSTVGSVSVGDFAFEVGIDSWAFKKSGYRVTHALDFGNWWTQGAWVEGLPGTFAKALEAGKEGRPFKLETSSGKPGETAVYVLTHPVSGKAEVMVIRDDNSDYRSPAFGTLGEEELAEIRRLEAEAEERAKWFEDHESLFFIPPPEDP